MKGNKRIINNMFTKEDHTHFINYIKSDVRLYLEITAKRLATPTIYPSLPYSPHESNDRIIEQMINCASKIAKLPSISKCIVNGFSMLKYFDWMCKITPHTRFSVLNIVFLMEDNIRYVTRDMVDKMLMLPYFEDMDLNTLCRSYFADMALVKLHTDELIIMRSRYTMLKTIKDSVIVGEIQTIIDNRKL